MEVLYLYFPQKVLSASRLQKIVRRRVAFGHASVLPLNLASECPFHADVLLLAVLVASE